MATLNLTPRELELVMAAIMAVTPSGGGSEIWSLYLKIRAETGADDADLDLVNRFCQNVITESEL